MGAVIFLTIQTAIPAPSDRSRGLYGRSLVDVICGHGDLKSNIGQLLNNKFLMGTERAHFGHGKGTAVN
jgi:hypothetical protein